LVLGDDAITVTKVHKNYAAYWIVGLVLFAVMGGVFGGSHQFEARMMRMLYVAPVLAVVAAVLWLVPIRTRTVRRIEQLSLCQTDDVLSRPPNPTNPDDTGQRRYAFKLISTAGLSPALFSVDGDPTRVYAWLEGAGIEIEKL